MKRSIKLNIFRHARQIPFVPQLEAADCGAACLAMALRYYGGYVELDELRETLASGRDGINALKIIRVARLYGLEAYGVRLEIEEIYHLAPGAILHWESKHFVVFEKSGKDYVDILDPAAGRKRIPLDQFRRSFTGIALLLEPNEQFKALAPPQNSTRRYLKKILAHAPWRFAQVVVITLLIQICALIVPFLTKELIDRIVPQRDYNLLTIIAIGAIAIILFQTLIAFVRAQLLLILRTQLDLELTKSFVEHLVRLPYSFFSRRAAGDLLMRLNSTSTIREMLTSSFLSSVLDGVLAFSYFIVLFFIDYRIALLTLLFGIFQSAVFLLSRARAQQLLTEDLEVQARAHQQQVQMFSAIETLKASGAEARAVEHWSHLFQAVLDSAARRGRMNAKVELARGIFGALAPVLLLWLGAWQVVEGAQTLGQMIAAIGIAGSLLSPLASLVTTAMQLQLLGSYIERLDDVLNARVEESNSGTKIKQRLSGKICLENVSFRYYDEAPEAVSDISLEILPGQSVAIVGPSGSGKSTLAKLLLGLYRPTAGRILYDDIDLTEMDVTFVRWQIGVVMQQPHLFGMTVREIIAFNNPSMSPREVVHAAQLAHIHDDILQMPLGYETPLVDGGVVLSGGQRQRLALARALAHAPSILLLDEATGHLDAITENQIYNRLAELKMTRIIIAHRLSAIRQADLILVMNNGRIIEQGNHQYLIQFDGLYAHLMSMQMNNTPIVNIEKNFRGRWQEL
jgi:ATP-binding cassette subfamily B protein